MVISETVEKWLMILSRLACQVAVCVALRWPLLFYVNERDMREELFFGQQAQQRYLSRGQKSDTSRKWK